MIPLRVEYVQQQTRWHEPALPMQYASFRFEDIRDPPKPEWLKIKPPHGNAFVEVKRTIKELGLHTVCESAHCPNLSECWSGGTATFIVLGNVCTRGCRFCAVQHGAKGEPLDAEEPRKLALAVKRWGLDYVVITSVDRDDLPDQGAGHFAQCIRELRKQSPEVLVEVLVPDFRGVRECIQTICEAKPHVIAHNVETTEDLQKLARDPRAGYRQSLSVLRMVKEIDSSIYTKSALMLGLGESDEMVLKAFDDLRAINCDFLTLGQYLRPSSKHLPVREFVSPQKFDWFKQKALDKGFLYCASSPFVRSSYKAGEFFIASVIKKRCALSA